MQPAVPFHRGPPSSQSREIYESGFINPTFRDFHRQDRVPLQHVGGNFEKWHRQQQQLQSGPQPHYSRQLDYNGSTNGRLFFESGESSDAEFVDPDLGDASIHNTVNTFHGNYGYSEQIGHVSHPLSSIDAYRRRDLEKELQRHVPVKVLPNGIPPSLNKTSGKTSRKDKKAKSKMKEEKKAKKRTRSEEENEMNYREQLRRRGNRSSSQGHDNNVFELEENVNPPAAPQIIVDEPEDEEVFQDGVLDYNGTSENVESGNDRKKSTTSQLTSEGSGRSSSRRLSSAAARDSLQIDVDLDDDPDFQVRICTLLCYYSP